MYIVLSVLFAVYMESRDRTVVYHSPKGADNQELVPG